MADKFSSQTTSTEPDQSVLGKILPWTQNRLPVDESSDIKHEVPVSKTENQNIPPARIIGSGKNMEVKTNMPDEDAKSPAGPVMKDEEIKAAISESARKRVSVLEMWNLIESVGIKREVIEKTFTSEEAVMELYRVIERRIHYQREQDMILRLKAYIEKLKKQEFEQLKTKTTN